MLGTTKVTLQRHQFLFCASHPVWQSLCSVSQLTFIPSCPLSQVSDYRYYNNVPPCLLTGESGAERRASPPTLTTMVLAGRQRLLAEI